MNLAQKRLRRERFCFGALRLAALLNGLMFFAVCGFLLIKGLPGLSWEFLSQAPRESMTAGGIFPAIMGTVILSLLSVGLALPLGCAAAVYLSEYAAPGRLTDWVRLGINNLAGVPSVVFGLFGLAFFVTYLGLQVSILSGALTLAALSLPVVIGTAEEAMRAVPDSYRHASLALGATKWQTIYRVVLPSALPGILTGAILALSRAAGETAAIMFTCAVFYKPGLPNSLLDSVMALPTHIYVLATAGTDIDKTRPLQYSSALVLVLLILLMNAAITILRSRRQKRR